jgi:hypothetical protein
VKLSARTTATTRDHMHHMGCGHVSSADGQASRTTAEGSGGGRTIVLEDDHRPGARAGTNLPAPAVGQEAAYHPSRHQGPSEQSHVRSHVVLCQLASVDGLCPCIVNASLIQLSFDSSLWGVPLARSQA